MKKDTFGRLIMKPALGLLALLFAATPAWAATYTWNMGAGSGNWSTSGNWSPSGVPGSGDDITMVQSGTTGTISTLMQVSRTVNVISKTGTQRWDITGATTGGLATLTANSIVGTTANFAFRNGNGTIGGMNIQVGNVSVSAGSTFFGVTDSDVNSSVSGLTVSGTTSVTGGVLHVNVQNASSNAYSLGLLSTAGTGLINLSNRGFSTSAPSIVNVTGLTGTSGFISSSSNDTTSSQSSTLAINNAGNFSSGAVIRNSASVSGTNPAVLTLTKAGSGTQTLSGANTYTGGTTITAGTLLITSTNGVGTGAVSISEGVLRVNAMSGSGAITNAVTITDSDGSYVLERASGMAYSAYTASSDIAGGDDTTASLLAGTASTARTLTTGFDATSSATNDGARVSDVFSLNGTGTDLFVLQLEITDVVATQYLGWLDGSNAWVNAVTGNNGVNNATGLQLDYAGSFASFQGTYGTDLSDYRGAYGFDTSANTVWAVLDHNSDFAVIPEPQTVFLAAFSLGMVVLLGVKRRKLTKAA